jgi:hypothetical protein
MARLSALLLVCLLLTPGCRAPSPRPGSDAPPPRFGDVRPAAQVLIITETEGPGGGAVAEGGACLETLIAHFDLACESIPAQHYEQGAISRYGHAFYLAGQPDSAARRKLSADLDTRQGSFTWVGPGVGALGSRAAALGLEEAGEPDAFPAVAEWSISYRGEARLERVAMPEIRSGAGQEHAPAPRAGGQVESRNPDSSSPAVLARARRGNESRPFICGRDRFWYAAAAPSSDRGRFWTACIWADALHEMLGQRHEAAPRRLVPVLRDVPVWATAEQAPKAIGAMLGAGVPVAVMAWTSQGEVSLADRPDAVRGLRKAESMGAAIALAADAALDAREHLRLAWEVGLHPVAWAGPALSGAEGPAGGENPFRLRIAAPGESPPYCAGGVLPAPVAVSDAGYISEEDRERLAMLGVVRDGVALASFGLWAPAGPFRRFLNQQESAGWVVSDLRDLGVRVEDARRTLLSGVGQVQVPAGAKVRQSLFSRDWRLTQETEETATGGPAVPLKVTAPAGGAAAVELPAQRPAGKFIKGVTLDPWAYAGSSLSAGELAEKLAERCRRNGVNMVFCYAYNVNQGAAYKTRYHGATISEWGEQDLLRHMLRACHERGIGVVAWMYSGRDRAMWKKHPEWRERTRDGKEYDPLRLHAAYFLCPRNPEVREWYAGLVSDLGRRYPELDGIELCEPVVNWFGDQACYCQVCNREFASQRPGEPPGGQAWRQFRADGMTGFLSSCMKAISDQGIDSYLMTLSDAWSNGAILSPRRQTEESGLDMEALLDGPHPPDWVNYEIIWQQWAAIYGTEVFNYQWAEETARRLARRTDGRARVIFHLELTDFGSQHMTPAKVAETIGRVKLAEPSGVECYHCYALDSRAGWPVLKAAYEELP